MKRAIIVLLSIMVLSCDDKDQEVFNEVIAIEEEEINDGELSAPCRRLEYDDYEENAGTGSGCIATFTDSKDASTYEFLGVYKEVDFNRWSDSIVCNDIDLGSWTYIRDHTRLKDADDNLLFPDGICL